MNMELSGSYPIIIDGKESGQIEVVREGLFWTFEATSTISSGIIRLSVFGDDGEGYLGVMQPSGEGLRLKKKLSRSALAGFPQKITHGGRQGDTQRPPATSAAAPATQTLPAGTTSAAPESGGCAACESGKVSPPRESPRPPPDIEPEHVPPKVLPEPPIMPLPEPPATLLEPETTPPQEPESPRIRPLVWRMCGCPASYLSSIEGKNVFGGLSNVLEANDGVHIYLAIPEETARLFPGQERIFAGKTLIMGTSYYVCRTKNGIIV